MRSALLIAALCGLGASAAKAMPFQCTVVSQVAYAGAEMRVQGRSEQELNAIIYRAVLANVPQHMTVDQYAAVMENVADAAYSGSATPDEAAQAVIAASPECQQ